MFTNNEASELEVSFNSIISMKKKKINKMNMYLTSYNTL